MTEGTPKDPHLQERRLMVDRQLRRRDIVDERVLAVMERVPRHLFLEETYRHRAYEDNPLPIGSGQTISQPYMVARMTELCTPGPTDRALEVGAGSGYQAAVLASLCDHVYAAEIVEQLARRALRTLADLGYGNVTAEHRDGSAGWPEASPFDIILVSAGAPDVPAALAEQLAEGGRLVIPVGNREVQVLRRLVRRGKELIRLDDTPCRFVNLRGRYGWDGEERRPERK